MKWKIVVCLLILLMAIPTAMAQGGKVITTEGEEMSFSEWLRQQDAPEASDTQVQYTFVGAILGVIGSTVVPYIISVRRNPDKSFQYSYLWSAFMSAILGALSVMQTLSASNPEWWFLLMAFLTTAGVKKGIGDTVLDADRKKKGG